MSAWAAKPFRVAYFETYSPFSFRKTSGTPGMQGVLVDILQEVIGHRLGLELQHTGYPWVRAQGLVAAGSEDAICTVPTVERLQYALASEEPVLSMPLRIYARADNPRFAALSEARSLDELKRLNPKVLSYIGNGWAKQNLNGFDVDWGSTFFDSVRRLIGRRGDVLVENPISMSYTLKGMPESGEVRALPNAVGLTNFHLLIGRQSPHAALMAKFDAALKKFKNEAGYKAILAAY